MFYNIGSGTQPGFVYVFFFFRFVFKHDYNKDMCVLNCPVDLCKTSILQEPMKVYAYTSRKMMSFCQSKNIIVL